MTPLLLMLLAAKPNPYLAQAKVFFQGGDYKQCLKRIEQAQKWDSSLEEQVDVAVYSGLCNFQLRKTKEAEADWKLALSLDAQAKLPPLTSPKAVALFEAQRPKSEAPPPPPVVADEKPPPPPPPTSEPPPRLVPQRSEPEEPPAETAAVEEQEQPSGRRVPVAGIIVGSASLVTMSIGVFFGLNTLGLDAKSKAAEFQSDAAKLRDDARGSALLANIGYAVAGGLLVTAIIFFIVGR